MRRLAGGSIDVAEVRRAHPIHEVVAASGVELQPRGHGFVGCCPFHEDVTPSLSVGGVPDRFHCFGCGASGDVIDYVRRRFDLGFVEAVAPSRVASSKPFRGAAPAPPRQPDRPTISRERAYEINAMAWDLFADPVGARFAVRVPAPPPRHRRHGPRGGQRWPCRRARRIGVDPPGGRTEPTRRHPGRAACRRPCPVHPPRQPDRHPARPRRHPSPGPRRAHRRLHRPRRQWRPSGTEVPQPRPHASVRQVAHPLPAHLGHASSGGDGGRRRRTTGRPRHRRHRSRRRPGATA